MYSSKLWVILRSWIYHTRLIEWIYERFLHLIIVFQLILLVFLIKFEHDICMVWILTECFLSCVFLFLFSFFWTHCMAPSHGVICVFMGVDQQSCGSRKWFRQHVRERFGRDSQTAWGKTDKNKVLSLFSINMSKTKSENVTWFG